MSGTELGPVMINIGDFARFAGVSVRMLRHYDETGLLVPAQVDPFTGYRRYRLDQLPVLHTLVALKELGFTLAQVSVLMSGRMEPEQLRRLYDDRAAALAERIATDRQRLVEVRRRIRLLEGEPTMGLEFVEKELPALTVCGLTDHVPEQSDIGPRVGPMFGAVDQAFAAAGRTPAAPGYAWYSDTGDGLDIVVGHVLDTPVPGTTEFTLPAEPRAVTAVYRGDMAGIGAAWQELGAHVQRLELDFAGPCREIYLQFEGPQSEWVTELQQPVR